VQWFRPTTLHDLLDIKARHPDAKIITGNTECGIETKLQGHYYPTLITPAAVPELSAITETAEGIVIGSGVTHAALIEYCKALIDKLPVCTTELS
jgi:xanthine dehydrogenase iron-sulfur cluster and FAD-binding subunit A